MRVFWPKLQIEEEVDVQSQHTVSYDACSGETGRIQRRMTQSKDMWELLKSQVSIRKY